MAGLIGLTVLIGLIGLMWLSELSMLTKLIRIRKGGKLGSRKQKVTPVKFAALLSCGKFNRAGKVGR